MRRRKQRHPALETAVFAAALLLAAFIGRELWVRRRSPPPETAPSVVDRALPLNVSFPPRPRADAPRRTEEAVVSVAPIKLTRVARPKAKPKTVPAPRG